MPASAAKFGDELAKAYGIVWEHDLFALSGDSRHTTYVEGFFDAQQEWLQNNLPEGGTLLPVNDYGQCQLPKKAGKAAHGTKTTTPRPPQGPRPVRPTAATKTCRPHGPGRT
jgi:hypothetical protein